MMRDWFNMLEIEPEERYHAAARSGEYLSSHMLADFRKAPLLYKRKISGLVPERKSAAYALGSAAHKLILEGRAAFDDAYIVSAGPINPKTGAPYGANTKAYALWEETQQRRIIAPDDMALIEAMSHAVWSHDAARNLLRDGRAEGVLRVQYVGMKCQARYDWLSPSAGIVDLKTCADIDDFERDARRYGYLNQMAFYRALVEIASGQRLPVHIIAVEKQEPYRAGVWLIDPGALNRAEQANEAYMRNLKRCRLDDVWPTGYGELRVLND